MTLLTYRRSGGGRPAFDEELQVGRDGSFTMVRRVSADSVGTFGGLLTADTLDRLRSRLAGTSGPLVERPTRGGVVLELVTWDGGSASFPLEHELPADWAAVQDVLHELVEDLKQQPVGAVSAHVADDGGALHLAHVGNEPVDVVLDGGTAAVALFDEDESWLGSATCPLPVSASGEPVGPGWRTDVPLTHGLDVTPQRTLTVTVPLTVLGLPGELTVVAGKGWS